MRRQLKTIDEELWYKAEQRCPRYRFESVRYFGPVIILITVGLQYLFQQYFGFIPPRGLSVAVVVVYLLATLLDTYTTQRGMCLKPAFEKKGYALPFYEANRLMPNVLTLRQNLLSWPSLFSLLGTFVVFFMPAVGVGAALLHLCTAWRNQRIRQRAMLQLALTKSDP